jgi:hypothetical protein
VTLALALALVLVLLLWAAPLSSLLRCCTLAVALLSTLSRCFACFPCRAAASVVLSLVVAAARLPLLRRAFDEPRRLRRPSPGRDPSFPITGSRCRRSTLRVSGSVSGSDVASVV